MMKKTGAEAPSALWARMKTGPGAASGAIVSLPRPVFFGSGSGVKVRPLRENQSAQGQG